MTEETLKRAIKYKKEIDSIDNFLRKTLPSYGLTLASLGDRVDRCEYVVYDEEVKEGILKIVKERRDKLEKALEEM